MIKVVESKLGLSYTMVVLACIVAIALFFAFIYKDPGHHNAKDLETMQPCEGKFF